MRICRELLYILLGVFLPLVILSCSSEDNSDAEIDVDLVTIQGQVDDGTAALPIANAECRFVNRRGVRLDTATADTSGRFQLHVPPGTEGFIGCNPPGFPNLILSTFISTVGVVAGATLPAQGFEKVSPDMTVVANIIAQTHPRDPRARKVQLLDALAEDDPDLTRLVRATTVLFNVMHEAQIADVDFNSGGAISGESGEGGSGSAGDGGGVSGGVGDGAEFSPCVNCPCEFAVDLGGDSALQDLLTDGTADRPELQAIAAEIAQEEAIKNAFARYFPEGMQLLADGQPLRALTDAHGTYFLPIPPDTPGFIRCTARADLALTTFVRGRGRQDTLRGQDVSPASHLFAALLLPQLRLQDVSAIQDNFRHDIGELREPVSGVVRVETVPTPEGDVMGDTDDDGLACSILGSPQAARIDHPAAGGAVFVAATLFKGLLLESRAPAAASYAVLLDVLLHRTDAATGQPFLVASGPDLELGGVPAVRAPEMAILWNDCVRNSIEQDLRLPLPGVVRIGRLRVQVLRENGNPLANAQVTVTGAFVASDSRCSALIEGGKNRLVCETNDNGRVTFTLFGENTLAATPVELTARSADGALQHQVRTNFIPPTTRDVLVTVTPL
jgi:hypothetical protein